MGPVWQSAQSVDTTGQSRVIVQIVLLVVYVMNSQSAVFCVHLKHWKIDQNMAKARIYLTHVDTAAQIFCQIDRDDGALLGWDL